MARVWIDLSNAPHVAFFLPIMQSLKEQGHELAVTLRDFNQTVELAAKSGIAGSVIGRHGGKDNWRKLGNLLQRAFQLQSFARRKRFDIAVSHNSYAQVIAGRLLNCRVVTMMDYEGQPANHIAFRLAHKIIVPAAFPEQSLRKFGAAASKVYRYRGFKEQLYLSDFAPDPGFISELRASCDLGKEWSIEEQILVTVRTPASMAAYHRQENRLFELLLAELGRRKNLTAILLSRSPERQAYFLARYPNLKTPRSVLDGGNLLYYSDLVISAGGTMNREAAVLGTPAYSLFMGATPGVDERLAAMGRLKCISSERQIREIPFTKKKTGLILRRPDLCAELTREILS